MSALDTTVTLHNGTKMPILGLGVYQNPPGKTTYQAVRWAIEAGYRHIDTARVYRNERDVGSAIRDCGVPREQLFITTKLWTGDHGADSTLRGFEASLKDLGIGYVDLFLSHFPVTGKRAATWKAMMTLLKDGRCRAIGVSNYTTRHLNQLMNEVGYTPTVNQVEFSPFLYQKKLFDFCREYRIQLEAYSPLTQGQRLGHPKLKEIAARHHKTTAQVMIRWAVQHGIVVIPKSVRRVRIVENASVFDFALSSAEMEELNALDENLRVCWDPTDTP